MDLINLIKSGRVINFRSPSSWTDETERFAANRFIDVHSVTCPHPSWGELAPYLHEGYDTVPTERGPYHIKVVLLMNATARRGAAAEEAASNG